MKSKLEMSVALHARDTSLVISELGNCVLCKPPDPPMGLTKKQLSQRDNEFKLEVNEVHRRLTTSGFDAKITKGFINVGPVTSVQYPTKHTCPMCGSLMFKSYETQLYYFDGVSIFCASRKCPAQEVYGHGKNEEAALQVIREKFRGKTMQQTGHAMVKEAEKRVAKQNNDPAAAYVNYKSPKQDDEDEEDPEKEDQAKLDQEADEGGDPTDGMEIEDDDSDDPPEPKQRKKVEKKDKVPRPGKKLGFLPLCESLAKSGSFKNAEAMLTEAFETYPAMEDATRICDKAREIFKRYHKK